MRHFKKNKYDTYITIKLAAANVQKLHFKKKTPAAVYVHHMFPTTSALIHRNFNSLFCAKET